LQATQIPTSFFTFNLGGTTDARDGDKNENISTILEPTLTGGDLPFSVWNPNALKDGELSPAGKEI
jgi:hypothetical protein